MTPQCWGTPEAVGPQNLHFQGAPQEFLMQVALEPLKRAEPRQGVFEIQSPGVLPTQEKSTLWSLEVI